MRILYLIQLTACAIVLATLAAAEAASWLLGLFPGSPLLWAINQELFRPIQQATYVVSPLHMVCGGFAGLLAFALLVAALVCARTGRRFELACISHLCLLFTVGVGRVWVHSRPSLPEMASLEPASLVLKAASRPEFWLGGPLVAAAAAAAVAGHLTFILGAGVRARAKPRPGA